MREAPKSQVLRRLFLRGALIFLTYASVGLAGETKAVSFAADGHLDYARYDPQGDIVLDFSHCGYGGGGVALPTVPAVMSLRPDPNSTDDTERIQRAIDSLSQRKRDANGFRGALLLVRGIYRIKGALKISASGVAVRGEGCDEHGTVIIAAGTARRSLIVVQGTGKPTMLTATRQRIVDAYVPVGARTFTVKDASAFHVQDTVFVIRHGNAAWIHALHMDHITPRPTAPESTKDWQPFDLDSDRVIVAIDRNRITVDAPLACAIDARWGGGEIASYTDSDRIEQVGVENLRAVSTFNPDITKSERTKSGGSFTYPADENHALRLVTFENVKNAWARDLVAQYFYHGVSDISGGAKWVTVQDCATLDPVSSITGGRRYSFAVEGQLNLVQRCYSREDRHAFVFGSRVPGPNVFLFCTSERNHATSEPHHRWSTGGLFDNVHADIAFQDRQWMGSGHGWAGANYVAWNTEGSLVCQQPPTAQNFAIGHVGAHLPGAFRRADGDWQSEGQHVAPTSLYLEQLRERLGEAAVENLGYADASGRRKS